MCKIQTKSNKVKVCVLFIFIILPVFTKKIQYCLCLWYHISSYFIARKNIVQKVICIGLPKTGTTSLRASLAAIGYSFVHCPHYLAFEKEEVQRSQLDSIDLIAEIYGLLDFIKL